MSFAAAAASASGYVPAKLAKQAFSNRSGGLEGKPGTVSAPPGTPRSVGTGGGGGSGGVGSAVSVGTGGSSVLGKSYQVPARRPGNVTPGGFSVQPVSSRANSPTRGLLGAAPVDTPPRRASPPPLPPSNSVNGSRTTGGAALNSSNWRSSAPVRTNWFPEQPTPLSRFASGSNTPREHYKSSQLSMRSEETTKPAKVTTSIGIQTKAPHSKNARRRHAQRVRKKAAALEAAAEAQAASAAASSASAAGKSALEAAAIVRELKQTPVDNGLLGRAPPGYPVLVPQGAQFLAEGGDKVVVTGTGSEGVDDSNSDKTGMEVSQVDDRISSPVNMEDVAVLGLRNGEGNKDRAQVKEETAVKQEEENTKSVRNYGRSGGWEDMPWSQWMGAAVSVGVMSWSLADQGFVKVLIIVLIFAVALKLATQRAR